MGETTGNAPTLVLALPDANATQRLGAVLGQQLRVGSVVLLQGDLGSGKTTLTQGLGQQLGISEPVASPTFALLHEYTEGRLPLYHFDLYRLASEQVSALAPEQYWEGLEVPLGIALIEWCDRLPYEPEAFLHVRLTSIAAGTAFSSSGATGSDSGRVATLSQAGPAQISLEAIAIAFEAALDDS
ncbi:MAG: tRNA (adenosine(37)-N6)-threonylcarbamoyltransferase complex ATPase subunit type 1 TsaE [Elainellaceae cyanobacterium]